MRALVCANEASRENTPPRGIHAAYSRIPSISTRYPAVRKALFPPCTLGCTHARARTVDEDDASPSEFTRTGEPPPRLKILSVGRAGSEESITREAVHSVPSTGLSFTRVVASLGLPATAGRHSTATTTPALPRYHYPHLVAGSFAGRAGRPRVPCRINFGEKHTARLYGEATRRDASRKRIDEGDRLYGLRGKAV